jgi:hypothetical protein
LEKKEYSKHSFFSRIEKGILVDDSELGLLSDGSTSVDAKLQALSNIQQPTPEAEVGLSYSD